MGVEKFETDPNHPMIIILSYDEEKDKIEYNHKKFEKDIEIGNLRKNTFLNFNLSNQTTKKGRRHQGKIDQCELWSKKCYKWNERIINATSRCTEQKVASSY